MEAIDAEVANATATREAEAAENAETIAVSKSAQVALETAMSLLPGFCKKAGQATALSPQEPAAGAPATCCKEWGYLGDTCCTCDVTSGWNTSWCYVEGGTPCVGCEDSIGSD